MLEYGMGERSGLITGRVSIAIIPLRGVAVVVDTVWLLEGHTIIFVAYNARSLLPNVSERIIPLNFPVTPVVIRRVGRGQMSELLRVF